MRRPETSDGPGSAPAASAAGGGHRGFPRRSRLVGAVLLVLSLLSPLPAPAARDQLSLAVGKPLQEAQKLMKDRKYGEALTAIGRAEGAATSDYEKFIVARMSGAARAGAGDAAGAARSFEQVIASGRLPSEEQLGIAESVASTLVRAKDYPRALHWLDKYRAMGGSRPEVLALRAQVHYLSGDFAGAAREAGVLVAAIEKSGGKPTEDQLRLLASSLQDSRDMAGYTRALEKLVRHYPTPAYWADLIQRTATRPGFSRTLDLDRYRLLRATGNLVQAGDIMQAAQLAVLAGLPGEAKLYIDEAYAGKLFGVGERGDIERQQRLRALVEKTWADDRKIIASTDPQAAAAPTGDPLLKTGLAYVTYGESAKGLAMMEQGIQKARLKAADTSRLHLGYAYYLSGDKARALAVLGTVGGTDGAADLARLWSLLAARDGTAP